MSSDKEEKIKTHLAKNPNLVLGIQKAFNKMDGRCRQMALNNPGRPMSDYCQRCQDMFKKILGDKK